MKKLYEVRQLNEDGTGWIGDYEMGFIIADNYKDAQKQLNKIYGAGRCWYTIHEINYADLVNKEGLYSRRIDFYKQRLQEVVALQRELGIKTKPN